MKSLHFCKALKAVVSTLYYCIKAVATTLHYSIKAVVSTLYYCIKAVVITLHYCTKAVVCPAALIRGSAAAEGELGAARCRPHQLNIDGAA